MSNTSINIIYILGTKTSLESLSKNLKKGSLPLDGLKVSKEWKQAKIEDPNFEFFFEYNEFVKNYSIPVFKSKDLSLEKPTACLVYKFFSSSFGGGLGEYFEVLSKKHPALQFIITWLIPDLGEVGRENQINGGIEDQQVIERDKNKASLKDYLKYSKHWFQYEFDDGFFDEYGGKDAQKLKDFYLKC